MSFRQNAQKKACTDTQLINRIAYCIFRPFVELQLETATNHQRSLAVLKFRVPLHWISLVSSKEVLTTSHPETAIRCVKLMNWLFST